MLDPKVLMGMTLRWEADPARRLWLKATTDAGEVFIRINNFPDEPLHSLELGAGVYYHFDDFPPTWSEGPMLWPDTAAPRWTSECDCGGEGDRHEIGCSERRL